MEEYSQFSFPLTKKAKADESHKLSPAFAVC
jgi:hypothetical protein